MTRVADLTPEQQEAIAPYLGAADGQEQPLQICEWFALCMAPATHRQPHPAFPDGVPTCDGCAALIEELSDGCP